MDIAALAASLLRRWYVVAVGALLTAGLGLLAVQAVPPTYTAAGSVLLLPPSAAVGEGSNQLLQLGGLEQPASLVVAYLAGDNLRSAFDAKYPGVTYDVVLDPLSRGPLIIMTVTSPTADTAMDALDSALATVPDALDALQDQVAAPKSSRFTSMPLSVDVTPITVNKATLRALIAAVGVGIALTLIGAVGLDSLLLRRKERQTARTAAGATVAAASGAAGTGAVGTRASGTGAPATRTSSGAPVSRKVPTRVGTESRPGPTAEPALPDAPNKDTQHDSGVSVRRTSGWHPVSRDDTPSSEGAPHASPRS